MEKELPDGDIDGELYCGQLLMAERMVAVRLNCAIRKSEVNERIIARDNLKRIVLPFARMPALPTPQCACQEE